jgi:putative ABC transport system permease protein
VRASRLITRGLTYYWRSHLAVVLGVATAVAVLAGALLVGDSVRGSLRDLVVQRLGRTTVVLVSSGFFREQLAGAFPPGTVPMVVARSVVTNQETGRRVGQVQVYGVDDRFWAFHGVGGVTGVAGPMGREAFVSPALADQLAVTAGSALLVRLQRPSEMPLESLHGRKDDAGRTLRLTVREVLPAARMGEFALDPGQGELRAVFVPLSRLQQDLGTPGRANTLLVAGGQTVAALEPIVRSGASPDDLELRLRVLEEPGVVEVGTPAGLLDDVRAAAVEKAVAGLGLRGISVFTYLANGLRIGDREIPYSLVTATDLLPIPPDGIVLNEWAASDLRARAGDALVMDYFAWEEPGQLATRSAPLRVAQIVPVATGDRDLAPLYPGISDSPTLDDWDPPFPVDLRRVRPIDEQYWERYRTTPKAFVSLETGQRLWRSRYGALTSVRVPALPGRSLADTRDALERALRTALDPLAAGLMLRDVRAEGLAASRGATDFGAYFVYFSFFLVVSALLLAALFFKLGVEQRVREVGLLRAVGFGPAAVRRLFTTEGIVLAAAGSLLGVPAAIGYAALLMYALRTWWVEAVGTTALTLHVTAVSLAAGAVGGVAAACLCIWWTLRGLRHISERSLLSGELTASASVSGPESADGPGRPRGERRWARFAAVAALLAAGLLGAGSAGAVNQAGAFFGAASLLLVGSLLVFRGLLRRRPRLLVHGRGWRPLAVLGFRGTSHRPGRSVVTVAVLASATFMVISVDAFRRDGHTDGGTQTGLGGYQVMVETLLPVVRDPNSSDGRDALNLFALEGTRLEPFRLLPGDDASCLNLYQPTSPRILAPRDSFIAQGRFAFQSSLAASEAERSNPWLLLKRTEADGAIPVIGDANSMTYVLHKQVGEDMVITRGTRRITLRFVAALRDSIFQGELLMAEANFLRLFPDQEGYRVLLAETAPERTAAVVAELESALTDFGGDAIATADRLAGFHRVENTYLSTFQTLGGLGLLLGTVGLATVLLRNMLERRRELALLSAVGYRRRDFLVMVLVENVVLLTAGLVAGTICAAIAVAPGVLERGGRLPLSSGALLLLFTVFVTGLLSSVAATRAATRSPLLETLRSE